MAEAKFVPAEYELPAGARLADAEPRGKASSGGCIRRRWRLVVAVTGGDPAVCGAAHPPRPDPRHPPEAGSPSRPRRARLIRRPADHTRERRTRVVLLWCQITQLPIRFRCLPDLVPGELTRRARGLPSLQTGDVFEVLFTYT